MNVSAQPISIPPPNGSSSQSLLWNLSGSTLVHILLILGLGFYLSIPAPAPIRQSISVNLTPSAKLSDITQIGAGKETPKSSAQSKSEANQRIIHTENETASFDNNTFLLKQQKLIEALNKENEVIESAERIGFLGVYDVHPAYKQYQEHWQQYVSAFGTDHYPSTLIENNLNGQLELGVVVDQHGVVRDVTVYQSSGNAAIDNAAIEIAKLASPYPPLPDEMTKEIDVLHIIRTWTFNNQTLVSKP